MPEPEKPSPKKKPFTVSLAGIALIIAILAFGTFMTYSIFHKTARYGTDYVEVNGRKIGFRANISDCLQVPLDESVLPTLLASQELILLMDPQGTMDYGLSVYEVNRMTAFAGIPTLIAYTQSMNDSTAVMSLSGGNQLNPVILFSLNQTTGVTQAGRGQILLAGEDQRWLDAAACRLGIDLIEERLGVKFK